MLLGSSGTSSLSPTPQDRKGVGKPKVWGLGLVIPPVRDRHSQIGSSRGSLYLAPSPKQCSVQGTGWESFLVSQTPRAHFMLWSTRNSDFLLDLSLPHHPFSLEDLHEGLGE